MSGSEHLTAKDVCRPFPIIIWFLQFFNHLLFLIEARNISALNLPSRLCAYTLSLFSLVYQNRHTNIGIIYSKEITNTNIFTTTACNNKLNANSVPRPILQIVGQCRKYKYKLRRQGRYMQSQAPDW